MSPTEGEGGGLPAGPADGPRQISLARLREFGVVPKRSLGQNFLVDDNILGLILDRLGPTPADVVLEVGAGLGVLTRALARAARHVHAFEIDRSLEPALRSTLGEESNVSLHFADVLDADLGALEPAPTLCGSNLPYSPAAPFLAEAAWKLPGIRRYTVMLQREVADRLMARPGTKSYSGISAWIQLHFDVVDHRPLSRAIFFPRPNVDSSLLTLQRAVKDVSVVQHPARLRRVIDAAFAQRRKSLVNSVSSSLGIEKAAVIGALAAAGFDPKARAEELPPMEFVKLSGAITGLMEMP